ncbi:unnamed protein product [Callosobruchus maculatus]|uniref:DNA primase large subunit C-terminal domain-containing protein n=1 Tax=Callosobruchus maculatus TaxID=64391 RepID=A0A653CVD0_CALMS|nr:unnamed protein product [Callosobruchus maculatus]
MKITKIFNSICIHGVLKIMTFYLKPPKGVINLHTLEECLKQRLAFYNNLAEDTTNFDENCLQYMIEDSMLDRAGHFLLRLIAFKSEVFYIEFLKNETYLLKLRLEHYGPEDLKKFMQRLQRQSKECLKEGVVDSLKDIINFIVYVANHVLCKNYLLHIFGNLHKESVCEMYSIDVPFCYCPSLIQNRQFCLKKGYVEVDCKNWQHLLLSLYHSYLRIFLREMEFRQSSITVADDIRIQDLIKTYYYSTSLESNPNTKFNFSQIHLESKYFPLCMLNLYKILESTNRLAHSERFDFSLYLKDIGLSLQDALKFWEMMYSKEHASCSRCTHSWQQSSKRYIYGIRHLYGLEGARKNYKARPCSYYQSLTLGPAENGGCPFKHFSDTNLRKALNVIFPNQDEHFDVIIRERHRDPSAACKLFYKASCNILQNVNVENSDFSSPVEYYLSFKADVGKLGSETTEI